MVYGFLILNLSGGSSETQTLGGMGSVFGSSSGSSSSSSSSPLSSLVVFASFYSPQANNALKDRRQTFVANKVQVSNTPPPH